MSTPFEKEASKLMALKISKLTNLSKRKKIKNNLTVMKEITNSIAEIKQSRLQFRMEQESYLTQNLLEDCKILIDELKSKDFRKQLISKTTLLNKTPNFSDLLLKYKSL